MSRWFWAVVVLAAIGGGIAIGHTIETGQEISTVALSVPILFIAGATLRYTIPKRAQLKVDRLDEAGLTDLIFYIYPKPNPQGQQQIPVDYLFQLHVAVCNVGDRKAVLSRISVDGFKNETGGTIHLPGGPETISGMQWIQQSGWVNSQHHFQNLNVQPPYVLEADDVIVIRFRSRRGIDWGPQWTLDTLKDFTEPIETPITSAFGSFIWRRGGQVVAEKFEVSLVVEQQDDYIRLVDSLTRGLTIVPQLPQQQVSLE